MKRSSVYPSVRLSRRSTAAAAFGGFAAEHRAGRISIDSGGRRRPAAAWRSVANVILTAEVETEHRLVLLRHYFGYII